MRKFKKYSLDTETTGLMPYHGDKIFLVTSTPIHDDGTPAPTLIYDLRIPEEAQAFREWFGPIAADPEITLYIQNAKFDMAFLFVLGFSVKCNIHCTQTGGFLVYNKHMSYSLEDQGERIGVKKDDCVAKYIDENKLTETRMGATQNYTHKFYDKVPDEIIKPYAVQDAFLCARLGVYQEKEIVRLDGNRPAGAPPLQQVLDNEKRLTKTLFSMESRGVRVDLKYCEKAREYQIFRMEAALSEFKKLTGVPLVNSAKCFCPIFAAEKEKWVMTDKGNPSFESDVLKTFSHPAAKVILEYRDALSTKNFFNSFLYFADKNGIVHPNFNQSGTVHGRMSASNPNTQNLSSEEDCEPTPFPVRKAVIPREGYVFGVIDQKAVEYRFLYELASQYQGYASNIAKLIASGLDPHQATADVVGSMGVSITRSLAKSCNFATIYRCGYDQLAKTIKSDRSVAKRLKDAIQRASPEVDRYTTDVEWMVKKRGWVYNWFGRRLHFPDIGFAYRAINYLIAGGAADVMKIGMNRIDDYLRDRKSKLVLNVHDELVLELHESEHSILPEVQKILETVFPHKYIPLLCSSYIGKNNYAELEEA